MSRFAKAKVLKDDVVPGFLFLCAGKCKDTEELSHEKSSVLAWVFRCSVMNGSQRVTHYSSHLTDSLSSVSSLVPTEEQGENKKFN